MKRDEMDTEAEPQAEPATDMMYDLIEYMEKQRYWMVLIVFACLILAPSGLLLNILSLLLYSVRFRFDLFTIRGVFFLLNILICVLLVYFGIKQATFLRRWNKKLERIKQFEKEVFKEVMEEK
jgi:hypothetical protein